MSWLVKLQNKSKSEKIRLLWIALIGTLLVLVLLWIIIGNVRPSADKNTDLFKTIDKSIKNFKFEKPKFP